MIIKLEKAKLDFEVNPLILHDMELLEMVGEVMDGQTQYVPKTLEKILGKEQKKDLYNHVRNKDGLVLLEDMEPIITELFEALNTSIETKN